jgi:hypothetical protein
VLFFCSIHLSWGITFATMLLALVPALAFAEGPIVGTGPGERTGGGENVAAVVPPAGQPAAAPSQAPSSALVEHSIAQPQPVAMGTHMQPSAPAETGAPVLVEQ